MSSCDYSAAFLALTVFGPSLSLYLRNSEIFRSLFLRDGWKATTGPPMLDNSGSTCPQ